MKVGGLSTIAVTGFDVTAKYSEASVVATRLRGVSGDDLGKITKKSCGFVDICANPKIRIGIIFAGIFPIGLLVPLISALLVRSSRFMSARSAMHTPRS